MQHKPNAKPVPAQGGQAKAAAQAFGVLVRLSARLVENGVPVLFEWYSKPVTPQLLARLQQHYPTADVLLVEKSKEPPDEDASYGVLAETKHDAGGVDIGGIWDGWFSEHAMALARLATMQQRHPDVACCLIQKINQHDEEPEPKEQSAPAEDAKPVLTLAEWAARDLPPPDFICGDWLTTTSRVLLFADTGIGKTLLAIAIGMAAAAGKPCLHWRGIRPANVLYIDGEMSRRLLKQRLADEAARLGVAPTTFFALSKEDFPDMEPLNTHKGQMFIIEQVLGKYCDNIDLIIFDNIMALIEGDQKDEEGWRETMPWIRTLTQYSIGQIWVHHTGHDTTRSYGTKTREWQMDTVIGLEQIVRTDTDVSFQLQFGKARERTPATRADYTDVNIALINNAWTWQPLSGGGQAKVSPMARKFYAALCKATATSGSNVLGLPAATLADWQQACVQGGLLDPVKANKDRAAFSKYKSQLIAANWVACNATMAWTIAHNPDAGPL